MTQDKGLKTIYLVVDALDECVVDLPKLLDLIARTSTSSRRVKWLLSSRNENHIEEKLKSVGNEAKLSLELQQNAEQVARAVDAYIDYKLSSLESLKDADVRKQVRDELHKKANGTFLWVALVVQELEQPESWDPLAVVKEAPAGLQRLYDRMIEQIQRLSARNADICQSLLCTTAVAYRPLYLAEMGSLCRSARQGIMAAETVRKIVAMCGSFLTVRNEQVYLVHQSARDYLSDKMRAAVLPSQSLMHYTLLTQSIKLLSTELKRGMSNLVEPGSSIDEVRTPISDLLATARYSCIYWADHLCESKPEFLASNARDQEVIGAVDKFLREKYLYWLEGLSLCKSVGRGVVSMERLWSLVQVCRIRSICLQFNLNANDNKGVRDQDQLTQLVHDARRFIMYHKGAIERYPLQTYASALLFSPSDSLIRRMFQHEEPRGVVIKPAMSNGWSACLQTLEGHSGPVTSVAFSHDSARLASASHDSTVKIWDAHSGACLQTIEDHAVSSADLVSILSLQHSDKILIKPHQPASQRVAVSSDNIWVSDNTQHELWLPTEYRPICSAVSGRRIGLGTGSGKVWLCCFT